MSAWEPWPTQGRGDVNTETPAAQLRAAAKLMRERAKKATPGPWRTHDTWLPAGGHTATVLSGEGNDTDLRAWLPTFKDVDQPWDSERNAWADAEHIASWHPLVALAVADWLEDVARDADDLLKLDTPECPHDGGDCYCRPMAPEWGCDRCGEYLTPGACRCWDKALAVARAYLGEAERAVRAQIEVSADD